MRKNQPVTQSPICVIIAAYNARETIGRAVRSALDAPEVAEVVVIDDASSDGSADAARAADDGTGRLRVLSLPRNMGPAAARNIALGESSAPIITMLDADDHVLPGRFATLLAIPGWDAIADNILFVPESMAANPAILPEQRGNPVVRTLDIAAFVDGNVSRPDRPRGELGFIKPLIRRDFLVSHGLHYDETLRLGEDFILYARMLHAGARFLLSNAVGYCAIERPTSLSGRHRTEDLAALLAADDALLAEFTGAGRQALLRHRRQLGVKLLHRQLLDAKRERGLFAGLACLARCPRHALDVARAVWNDKRGANPAPSPAVRYLLD